MNIFRLLLVPFLLLSMASMAQEGGEQVNIRISEEGFDGFAKQVEAQTNLVIYYKSEWFSGRMFSYESESVRVDDAFSRVLLGTGLHFSRAGDRYYILPGQRLNLRLPVLSSSIGRYKDSEVSGTYLGVKDDLYLTGTRPEKMARVYRGGSTGCLPCTRGGPGDGKTA